MYLTSDPLHANCVPLDEHLRVLNDFKIMLEESNAKSDHIITLQKTVIEYSELIIELGEQVKLPITGNGEWICPQTGDKYVLHNDFLKIV